ncbi:uncharacterized protein LOC141632687 [Silene latifolia]|uniref:uncharacterized protein LOC141632687 n=1 Tax=Silene latifolia TaxID=37657 RepID=UPI003D786F4F
MEEEGGGIQVVIREIENALDRNIIQSSEPSSDADIVSERGTEIISTKDASKLRTSYSGTLEEVAEDIRVLNGACDEGKGASDDHITSVSAGEPVKTSVTEIDGVENKDVRFNELDTFGRCKVESCNEVDSPGNFYSPRNFYSPVHQGEALSPTVSSEAADTLILPITNEEIKAAIFTIGSDKSPGPDRFSSAFFKHSWPLIGESFCKAVHSFFSTGRMSKQANSTFLALIPKKKVSSTVMDFRPISCCTTFYKTISKIISTRLSTVLPLLVGPEQAAFVKGRSIHENIMLSQSLVKGYGRKYLTPRCLIRVDIRKAFDSLQWSFIENMLTALKFPPQFISWIMGCLTSSWFSLKLNGSVHGFFQGKSGVRYLGLPLNTARTTVDMYGILVNKIQASIQHWSSKLLSYAGRLQLLNSVVFGIENFWCASVLLPKSVIKTINKLCKNFFWHIKATDKKMIVKSWSNICAPTNEGGFGVKELLSWNKALISKWLWLLDRTPQELWSIWHSEYHLSHCSIWDVVVQDMYSENFRSIISVKNDLLSATGSPAAAKALLHSWCSGDKFHVAAAYTWFRPCHPTVSWSKGLFHRVVVPRHNIITSLACQQKLATVDKLILKGFITPNRCVLCKQASETHDHLFFPCPFSQQLWHELMVWTRVPNRSNHYHRELDWCLHRQSRRHWKHTWFLSCLTCAIYTIWKERNCRIFSTQEHTVHQLLTQAKFIISVSLLYRSSSLCSSRFIATLHS